MPDVTISGLPNATTPLTGAERIAMDQAGVTVDATAQDIADLAAGATDLGYTPSTRVLTSSTGTDVTLPLSSAVVPGLLSPTNHTRLQTALQPGVNSPATVFAITDGASVVINPDNGALQTWTLGANRTPTAAFPEGASVTIHITAGAFTINWTTVAVTWLSGAAPVLAASGITPVTLYRVGGVIFGGSPIDVSNFATNLNGLSDVVISSPASNQVLLFNGTNWVNAAAPGGGGGTVSNVALSVPTGLSVAGSPVTTTGTLAITYAAGYAIPTTAKQTEWDTAFSQTRQWNGSATGLVAATGRTSLGLAPVAASGVYSDLTGRPDLSLKADLVGGVIPTGQLPALAVTEFLGTVASQSAMLALTGQRGDWAIRSDAGTTWVLTVDGGSLLAHWQQLSYPAAPVSTVNGQAGAVVLGAGDVGAAPASHNQAWSTITATPTTLAGYGIADAQPLDSDLTAIAALTTTSFGRSFLDRADAAAARTHMGLGTAATSAASAFAAAIASGTAAMGTTAIASGASATVVTVAATGVATTDVIDWGFNANPNSVTGYSAASATGCLVITAYPTAGNVNFVVSNPTAASITPGALTLNWKVTR